jgi:hypothetical protein
MSSSSSSACSTRPKSPTWPQVDGVGVVAEVAVGQLLQPRQLGVDLRGARDVGGARGRRGASGLRVDRDAVIHALFRPEAKRPADSEIALKSEHKQTTL